MALIAAPARQLKTWSTVLLLSIGVFDLAVAFAKTIGDLHVMNDNTFAALNAGLVFVATVLKFIRQNIPLTTQQKADIVEAAAAQPLKQGEEDITVHINATQVPSTPQEKAQP